MKLAKQPYKAMVVEDENGKRYALEGAENWKNVWILKNKEYRIVNSEMEVQEEVYVDVKKAGKYLLLYRLPEQFLILDENGNYQKDENGEVVVGKTYQEAEDCLVVETQYKGECVLFKKRVQYVKKVLLLSKKVKTDCKFIGVIKLTYENKLLVETADSEQEIEKELFTEEIHIERFFYDLSEKEKVLKIILYAGENTYATSLVLGEKLQFVKLLNPIEDSCKDLPYHLMYLGEKGERILYNVRNNTMIQIQKRVDGIERRTVGDNNADLYFWRKDSDNKKIYTELYTEANGELINAVYYPRLKRLEMQTSPCCHKYDAWIGTSYDKEEIVVFTKESFELIQFVKRYQAKDNYFLCEQISLYSKDYCTLYRITNKIEKVLIESRFENPKIFMGTKDIVVISEEKYRYIYYKWILLKREENDGTRYLQNDFSEKECQEQWQEIRQNDGFISVPGVDDYFIDYRKNKAYSSIHPIYCWKKIVQIVKKIVK